VSDFGNPAQGPLGGRLTGVAIAPNGSILVTDRDPSGAQPRGVLFLVNFFTGMRTVLSNFGNAAQGPLGVDPTGVATGISNVVWVIDPNAGTGGLGALFRVNLSNGTRALVSDFGNAAQGPRGVNPFGVALDAVGGLYVVDRDAGTSGRSALFYVDPTTGIRTLVSNFGNLGQGPLAQELTGVAVNAAGNILVIDLHSGVTGFSGLLLSVDPATGIRTVVSDFGNLAQGPRGIDPIGVTLVSTCGDGNPDFTEQCDDGNTVNGDGCSATCRVEPGAVVCAKRIVPRAWVGTPGNDTFVGTSGADIMHGLGGNDSLFGGAGRDIICGGDGNDMLRGGSSNDILEGGAGNDLLIGDNDKDILRGDSGDDLLRGGANSDTCDGGTHIRGDVAIDCETKINVP
jgi:cysteine-rich repeat protein